MSIIYEALKKIEKKDTAFNIIKKEEPKPKSAPQSSQHLNKVVFFVAMGVGVFVLTLFVMHLFHSNLAARETSFYEETRTGSGLKNVYLDSAANEANFKGYQLQGIIYTENNPLALINGKRLSRGEKIGEAVLKSLSEKGVELETKDGKIQLSLE